MNSYIYEGKRGREGGGKLRGSAVQMEGGNERGIGQNGCAGKVKNKEKYSG